MKFIVEKPVFMNTFCCCLFFSKYFFFLSSLFFSYSIPVVTLTRLHGASLSIHTEHISYNVTQSYVLAAQVCTVEQKTFSRSNAGELHKSDRSTECMRFFFYYYLMILYSYLTLLCFHFLFSHHLSQSSRCAFT